MIDLQRRVIEREALVQHRLHLAPRGVAVALAADEHVRGERGEAARDFPDVQVVDLDDGRLLDERAKETVNRAVFEAQRETIASELSLETGNRELTTARAEAKADLFEYIEVFYNRRRRHSTLGNVSPTQFMHDWIAAQNEKNMAA